MHTKYISTGKNRVALGAFLLTTTAIMPAWAQDQNTIILDEVSVTATRAERGTKDVPLSITVVGEERIENETMYNIQDALQGTAGVQINSKNGGFDSRLVIRGAGQKAAYGVREIMVLRDGVPMTDPDSFSRFDFIDTQDIERIEVTKGPGSIHGGGSAGGVIQILSKSVFDTEEDRGRVAIGTNGMSNMHARAGTMIGDDDAIAVTLTRRNVDNGWRPWNKFENTQGSLKHGHIFQNGGTLETEISFANVNMQLPGTMDQVQFNEFIKTGKQDGSSNAFVYSGRDSNSYFFNSRYELEDGNITYKPKIYANKWSHYHPVTAAINVSPNNYIFGGDAEINYAHTLLGESLLVAGLSARMDITEDSKKYEYRDRTEVFGNRITAVLNDQAGDLMAYEDATHLQTGVFVQETVRPNDRSLVDVSFRYDQSEFKIDKNELIEYDYSGGDYQTGSGPSGFNKTFNLFSSRIGGSYGVTDKINVYGSAAQSDQVPSNSELESNNGLDKSTMTTFEVGTKGRAADFSFDAAVYYTIVDNEIVSVTENNQTVYNNAGEVEKKGLELAGKYAFNDQIVLGANYAYSDYTFLKFEESVSGTNFSRDGNAVPFVPKHQYSLSANYDSGWGLKAGIRTETWSPYQMDNANTEKYAGYKFITHANSSVEINESTSLALNIINILDKHYAVEAKKSTRGSQTYSAGQPRTAVLTLHAKF